MKKDKKWAIKEAKEAIIGFFDRSSRGIARHYEDELIASIADIINQLDESENLSIEKEQLIKRIENYIPLHDKTFGDVVDGILEIVKQLPEMEVLSPEWIDEHAKTWMSMRETERYVKVDDLQTLFVPKQEELESKIKVLIEAYKQEDGAYSNPENGWISGFVEDLENLVEEEQKYRVTDRNTTLLGRINGMILTTAQILEYYPEYSPTFKLTEQEIKDYDERYWPFAKPVEELEE